MKIRTALITALAACALSIPAARADDDALSPEKVEQIMQFLADLRCEMDPDDIEVEDGEIELDDVFCGGGQFDFELNEDLHLVGARAEQVLQPPTWTTRTPFRSRM